MAVGASGRHGNHAVWRVEGETGHVLAHALIQRQNGTEWIALGQIYPQRAAICTNVKVGHRNSKLQKFFHLWTLHVMDNVTSDHQWMAVGASGRHGDHAAWRVEEDSGHALAHALIQRQNGTEMIAPGQISPQRTAVCANVKVDASFERFFQKWSRLVS